MAAIRAQFLGLHFKRLLFLLLRVSPYTFGRFIYIYTYINIYIYIYIYIFICTRDLSPTVRQGVSKRCFCWGVLKSVVSSSGMLAKYIDFFQHFPKIFP